MVLTVAERLMLLQILPPKGNYVTLKILTQLRLSLGFTEDELKKWGIVQDPESNRISWASNERTEIPVGEVATGMIVDSLRMLDKKEELPFEYMGIYEKFIPTTE